MHVIINGVSSETLQGVQVLSLPPITKPRMRTSVAVIDGRPGDIVTRLGYEAYNRKIRILLHHDYDIDAISAFFNTSGTIIFSNEPDMEYEFETIDAFSFERAVQYKTADITFHVQPYKLSATEQPATGEVSTLVDKTPYIIRRTPFGTRQKGTIVGGSMVWNQLSQTTRASFTAHGLTYVGEDGKTTVTGTFTGGTSSAARYGNSNKAIPAGHKVALLGGKSDTWFLRLQGMTYTPTKGNDIIETTDGALADIVVRPNLATNTEVNEEFYFQIIDLTLLFGPTIADYIYSKEQAHAGDGIALAKAWAGIITDYYPYDAGTIKSVTGLTSHKTTGFNQWDEEWEVGSISGEDGQSIVALSQIRSKNYIPVIQGETYYIRTAHQGGVFDGTLKFYLYDANKRFVESPTPWYGNVTNRFFTVPEGVSYIRFIGTASSATGRGPSYIGDICINISDPAKNGTYEPYDGHVYPLDSSLTLRGLPKLDGGSLYYDGDIYKADGTVERRYKLDDLATITWQKQKTGTVNDGYSAVLSSAYKAINGDYVPPFLCDKYEAIGATNANLLTTNVDTMEVGLYGFRYNGNTTVVYLVVPTGSTISGNLVYELAEPTTETAEPYTALQICDPAGTEEWVGASMPVGHETAYIDPISMTVTNEGNTESAPSITIEGEGPVEVTVDGLNILQIQMPASGEITIDSRTLDATDGEGGLANRSVTGDYNDLRLTPGEHTVTVTGDVTSVTLKNTSRWI